MKKESFLQSIGSSVLWKVIDRGGGLWKHVIIAGAMGLSSRLDVFYIAMALMGIAVFGFGRLMDVMAIPKLVERWNAEERGGFDRLSGGLFVFSLGVGAVLGTFIGLAGEHLSWFAVGFDPARRAALASGFVWLVPAAVVAVPSRFLGALFRSTRQFTPFYQTEALITLVTLVCVAMRPEHPDVLLWSISAGMVAGFAFLLVRAIAVFRLWGAPLGAEVRAVLATAPGLWVVQVAVYFYQLSDRLFQTFLPPGAIGALMYGWVLVSVFPGFLTFANSFITVFAERRAKGDDGVSTINDLISLSILLSVPLMGFLLVAGQDMVAVLLERGLFSRSDTQLTTVALVGYAWAILPLFLTPACNQIFQVLGKVGTLVRRAFLGFFVNMALNAIFLFGFQLGILGIALATAASQWFMMLWMVYSLDREGIRIDAGRHLRWATQVAFGTLGGLIVVASLRPLGPGLWVLFAQAGAFGVVLAGLAFGAPGPEGQLIRYHSRRLVPRRLQRRPVP